MKKLLVFLFAAFIGLSLDVRVGDLRYSVDGYTVRHWEVVPQATFFKPACALVKSGGYPCPGSGGATSYTLTGPATGTIGIVSSNYTVTGNGTTNAVVTPADASHGGVFNPTTVTLNNNAPVTFTYDPLQVGTYNISTTNGGGLSNPAAISFSVSNALSGYPSFVQPSPFQLNDTTVTNGVAGDPFGGSNASNLVEDNVATYHYIFQNYTDTSGITRSVSAFVKNNSGTRNAIISLCDTGFSACFQGTWTPSTCTLVQTGVQGTGIINSTTEKAISNGWCLVSITGTLGAFTSVEFGLSLANGTTQNYQGDGTSSLLIYGASIQ